MDIDEWDIVSMKWMYLENEEREAWGGQKRFKKINKKKYKNH